MDREQESRMAYWESTILTVYAWKWLTYSGVCQTDGRPRCPRGLLLVHSEPTRWRGRAPASCRCRRRRRRPSLWRTTRTWSDATNSCRTGWMSWESVRRLRLAPSSSAISGEPPPPLLHYPALTSCPHPNWPGVDDQSLVKAAHHVASHSRDNGHNAGSV